MKPKVIFCTRGIFPFSVGGIQRHSKLLIEELAKRNNVDITVIHPHSEETVFDPALKVHEIAVPDISQNRPYLLELYNYSQRVASVLNKTEFSKHLIYAQGFTIWKQIERFKHRLIYNPHGLESFQTISSLDYIKLMPFRILSRHLFNNAARVISLGGKLTDIINRNTSNGASKIATLPNATHIPKVDFTPSKNREKVICLFVGRFAENKGIVHLLRAVKIINEKGYGARFHFVLGGKGPLFKNLRKEYGNLKNVEFKGFVDDNELKVLYQAADVFILPTLFEGMPTVILEAMSYRLPIIVTDVGATRELVGTDNGFIIPKASPDGIVECLLNFDALPPEQRVKSGEASYAKVKDQFSWGKVAELHEKLFLEIHQGNLKL